MNTLEGRDFFDHIRRSVKISHFVASIIPLALLAYFSIKYVYPYVTRGNITNIPLNIGILLFLAVVTSVLGLILTTKATNSSILSAQDLSKKINRLFEITKQFRETIHLDILLKNIMQSAMDLTSADLGALLLFDEKGILKIEVSSGQNLEGMKSREVKPGEGIAAHVAETGKGALVNDVLRDNRYNPKFDTETGYKTRSLLCVPLICSGEVIGVIELRNREEGTFTKQDEALLNSLADQASISITQNRLQESQKSDFIQITEILVGTQDHIQDKRGHARRVAHYANLTGKKIGLSETELKNLYYACLFHDIGFMKIDMKEQWDREKIMNHPRLGYDMIKSISPWRDSADMILYHHERYDGRGYPGTRTGDAIPLGARILFVADAFDVLTSKYSYKKPLAYEYALKEIETNSGTQFDPEVVEAFRSAVNEADLLHG